MNSSQNVANRKSSQNGFWTTFSLQKYKKLFKKDNFFYDKWVTNSENCRF